MQTNSTTLIAPALPLAHSANTDAAGHWAARLDALSALRDARIAQGEPADVAADYAIFFLDAELEAQAAQLAAAAVAATKRAASQGRAAAKASYHLAGGVQVRKAASGAWLVPSSKGNATIYVVSAAFDSCTCKAGEQGAPCWHTYAAQAVAQLPEPTPPAPIAFDAARVLARLTTARAA